jgi:hypothetical protein
MEKETKKDFLSRLRKKFPRAKARKMPPIPPIFKALQLAHKGYKAFSGGKKAAQSAGAVVKLAPQTTRNVPIKLAPQTTRTVPINQVSPQSKTLSGAQRFFKRAKTVGEKLDNIDEVQMVKEAEEEKKQKKDYLSKQGLSRAAILSGYYSNK